MFDAVRVTGRMAASAAEKSVHGVEGSTGVDVGYSLRASRVQRYKGIGQPLGTTGRLSIYRFSLRRIDIIFDAMRTRLSAPIPSVPATSGGRCQLQGSPCS